MISKLKSGLHAALALLATAVFVLPLFWVIIASLRQPGLPPAVTIEWWPQTFHWQNYTKIFTILPMARYTLNSLYIVAVAVPVTLVVASLAGFSMAQMPPKMQKQLLFFSVAMLLIPGAAIWLFRFQILRWLGLVDSLWAVIIPAFAGSNPLFVLLYYWTYRRIPVEIFEAAQLDGATMLSVWWWLGRPLTWPTTGGVIVLTFVLYWSDFIGPVLYLYDTQLYTLPVGLQILNQLDPTNIPLLMSASVVMSLPVVLLFLWLQRYFLHNLSLTNLFEHN
jgi:multiple sugar transport system permease protein